MLRKIAAGTSAAVVAAGLAAAPGVAAGIPAPPGDVCGDPSCVSVVTDFSGARRRNSSPPVGTPTPEAPSSPPQDSAPEAPPPASPPVETAGPPADTSSPLPPAPVESGPPPAPRALGGPGESVLPETQPPSPPRLPQTASETRPLTAAGGGSLIAAGLAWIGGARRRRKRPIDPAVGD